MLSPTPIRPYPDDLDVDDDGYPSDDALKLLAEANDYAHAPQWMSQVFPRIVRSIPCGHIALSEGQNTLGRPIYVIEHSTGGWSGQEALVYALEKNGLSLFYLESWRRGGHYVYWIPKLPK